MRLARNAAFNLFGAGAPALLSVVTLPYVVAQLGAVDFGVLALVTAIVGYFALLDVNVTAGSTKYVAEFKALGDGRSLSETVTFSFSLYVLIGLVGAAGLYAYAEPLVRSVFDVPPERHGVAGAAVQVAALGFLLSQLQAYVHSLPGALMRYDVSGSIEAAFGSALPVLTVLLLWQGFGLVELIWLRVVMSALQTVVLSWAVHGLLPELRFAWPQAALRRKLLGFSAYAFLSRIASVTYAHADKLIIGARVGVASLTYYVVPSTLANRVMGLVFRLSGVMFPHASAMAAAQRHQELAEHYVSASRYMFFLNGAIALTLVALAHPLLSLWLSPEFARLGATVLVLIALAQWADSTTNLPSLVNDGLGHPRVSGLFALTRAVVGLATLFAGVALGGIEGAAAAHLLVSVLMATAFLVYVHQRTVPVALGTILKQAYAPVLGVLLPMTLLCWALAPLAGRGWPELLAAVLVAVAGYGVLGFVLVLRRPHRHQLLAALKLRKAHGR